VSRSPGSAEKRLEELAATVAGARRVLVLTHDNPDPDSIASGWALMRVLRRIRRMHVDLGYGGIIGRSENRTLRELLNIPLVPLDSLDIGSYQAIALVDCQPHTGNSSLPAGLLPTIVIDHHPLRRLTREVQFYDIREDYGASATIMSEYLQASGVRIDRHLATAMFYAIKTETQNLVRDTSNADVRTFLEYFPRVDNQILSRVEHPPIPRDYFSMIDQAIAGTRLHGRLAVTIVGPVSNPDVVAEFADLMLRLENIQWSLSIGRFNSDLIFSIRTSAPRANAGRIIRRIVGGRGKAGGHGTMAGGKIERGARSNELAAWLEGWMLNRSLEVLKADPNGVKLVDDTANQEFT